MSAILEKIFANKDRINKGKEIILLAIVAVFGIFISSLEYFLIYDYSSVSFYFPDEFNLFSYLLRLAPSFVFAFFMIQYHKLQQNEFLKKAIIPITLGLMVLPLIFGYFDTFANVFIHRYYSLFDILGFGMIVELVFMAAGVLVVYSGIRDKINKKMLMVAVATGMIVKALSLERIQWLIAYQMYLFTFLAFVGFVGAVALYAAILLYGLNNDVSVAVQDEDATNEYEEENVPAKHKLFRPKSDDISVEEALYRLNHQFDADVKKDQE